MISPQQMADAYGRNVAIVKMQTQDMTQAESLLQLPFRANCMNWLVGHLLTNRNNVLGLLNAPPALDAAAAARYTRDSPPIAAAEPAVLQLDDLLAALEDSQERLAALLAGLGAEDMEREVPGPGGRKTRLGSALFFFFFHDSYHTGQTEILRQASGKDDKVI
jgi:hypothetical protein